ncbi:MAG: S41 family peptidase [Flavobacteriales bacterium]
MREKLKKTIILLTPVFISLFIISGIYIGLQINKNQNNRANNNIKKLKESFLSTKNTVDASTKIEQIINYIDRHYVDSVKKKKLRETAIKKLLHELDPHSVYISKDKIQKYREPIEGNFEGVGIQFMIRKDTVVVVSPIPGGPSEAVGIKAGDRIVKVEDELIAGNGVTNKKVMNLLRGEKGSEVQVSIKRRGQEKLITKKITRDKIPINSVEANLILENKIGYIRINRFAKNTYNEFKESVKKLKNSGMQRLVLDLRGNGGGLLKAATKILNDILTNGELIVYTEGRAYDKKPYYADKGGMLKNKRIAVLIDRASASASEIVAGAIQDNDRGIVVGRRSFGKGLVQEPVQFNDGSAMRLTTARYHTPSGRCIQKPYKNTDYHDDIKKRVEKGELVNKDSIDFPDSLKYRTKNNRIVYGGGGIMPDIFVPIDTQDISRLYKELVYTGILNNAAFEYADKHRKELNQYQGYRSFKKNFKVTEKILSNLIKKSKEKNIEIKDKSKLLENSDIKKRFKAIISRNIWDDKGYYSIMLEHDRVFNKAKKNLISKDYEKILNKNTKNSI